MPVSSKAAAAQLDSSMRRNDESNADSRERNSKNRSVKELEVQAS